MTRTRLLITAALVGSLPAMVSAGPDRISFLLGSEHVNATRDFQEFNPGVFLTWEQPGKREKQQISYSVGAFYNSYEDISVLASVGYDWEVATDLELGVFGAIAYYPGEGDEFRMSAGDLVPFLGLQARYGNVFAQLIPADGESLDALFTLGLTFALD